MLPVLGQDIAVNNQLLKALKEGIVISVRQSLGLEIVEEHIDFFGCEGNTHMDGKGHRCSNQSNDWKHKFIEANGYFLPKSLLED